MENNDSVIDDRIFGKEDLSEEEMNYIFRPFSCATEDEMLEKGVKDMKK